MGIGGEEVDRDGEVHAAFAAGVGDVVGLRQVSRNLHGGGDFGGPLGDGLRHADLVDVLKGLAMGDGAGAAATDGDEGAAGKVGGGDAGERVGVAGSAGDQREGGTAMDARPGVGSVGDG